MAKRIIQVILLLLILTTAVLSYRIYRELMMPITPANNPTIIEIPDGASRDMVFRRLYAKKIIAHEWPLRIYVMLTTSGDKIKAGEYEFSSPASPLDVLSKLKEGGRPLRRLTIIEGWDRWDIAVAMARVPEFKLSSVDEAIGLMNETSEIRDLDPNAKNLEGYLFPDTYSYDSNTSPGEFIAGMVRQFKQEWNKKFATLAREKKMSVHDVVTIASIVETEVKLNEERPLAASVIFNRLKKQMPLGVDSSVIYAAKLNGIWKNDRKVYQSYLDLKSPYNSRINTDLPPGPISSPGVRSIEATLNPATSNYLYYVRDPERDDG
ncbi:MAG: endolytic transglycosylase MltG, partial [Pyrinomonadaceae bacterium]